MNINPFAKNTEPVDLDEAAGSDEIPTSLRREPQMPRTAGLQAVGRALERQKPPPPAEEPQQQADPLHPGVAGLMNHAIVAAARKMGEERIKSAQKMFDEAASNLEGAIKWAAGAMATAEKAAIQQAAIHAKQRHAHASMARVQAEYESGDLPPVEATPPERTKEAERASATELDHTVGASHAE